MHRADWVRARAEGDAVKMTFNVRSEEYLEAMTIVADTFKALRKSGVVRSTSDTVLFILRQWRDYMVNMQAEANAEADALIAADRRRGDDDAD